MLLQRLDPLGRFLVVETPPVPHQFSLMQSRPFQNHGRRTAWQRSIQRDDGLDSELGLGAPIICVKMRRIMVNSLRTFDDLSIRFHEAPVYTCSREKRAMLVSIKTGRL